jgi:hypothetical protein
MTIRALGAVALALGVAVAPLAAQGTGGRKGTAARTDSVQRGSAPARDTTLHREVFSYSSGGRRDPMVSLMNTSDLRPLISEVQIVAIAYDEGGSNHLAVLRNTVDKKNTLYRVRVGQMLGRMKVTQITRTDVVFTLDEFGFSRQERLSIKPDTTAKRTP